MLRTVSVQSILAVVAFIACLLMSDAARAQSTLTTTTTGQGRVTSNYQIQPTCIGATCYTVDIFGSPSITLTAIPDPGWTFGGWSGGGGCSSQATCIVSLATSQTLTATFSLITFPLTVTVSGSGTVTSTPAGLNCPGTCSGNYAQNAAIALRATPAAGYAFTNWSGGSCSGSTAVTCNVTMSSAQSTAAIFTQLGTVTSGTRISTVFSSAQPSSNSFLRIINAGETPQTATITLADYTSGNTLATWRSSSIPGNSAQQILVAQIEEETGIKSFAPQYYTVSVAPMINGYVQHILYRPADQTVTNLSTCSANVTVTAAQAANVHSSLFGSTYDSYVTVVNTGASAASAVLWIYNATSGALISTYDTPVIQPNAEFRVLSTVLEKVAPNGVLHYVVKIKNPETFTGFVQHHVLNNKAGVMTDMSTICALDTGYSLQFPQLANASSAPVIGEVYSNQQQASTLSFIRFMNTSAQSGRLFITLRNANTGAALGTYTTGLIGPYASPQIPILTAEQAIGLGGAPSSFYTVQVESEMNGNLAHILYRSDGTLTNSTTCSAGIGALPIYASNVHSTRLGSNFTSSIAVHNTGTVASAVALGIYDANNGTKLRTYTTSVIPVNGQVLLQVPALEQQLGLTPTTAQAHYNIVIETPAFTGYIQHLMNNALVGVITDMTTACRVIGNPKQTVTVAITGTGSVSSSPSGLTCSASSCSGQFSKGSNVTLTATAGTTYNFVRWTESSGSANPSDTSGGTLTGCHNSTNATCTFAPNSNISLTAVFSNLVPVTVTVEGNGTVTSSPSGINCSFGSCQSSFTRNNFITLTATPNFGYQFQRWNDPGQTTGCNNSISTTCGFSPTQSSNVTAVFTQKSVSITFQPFSCTSSSGCTASNSTGSSGGTIDQNGSSHAARSVVSIAQGETRTLTAVAASGYVFDHWEGATGCSISTVCFFTASADAEVRAYFRSNNNGLGLVIDDWVVGPSDTSNLSINFSTKQVTAWKAAGVNNLSNITTLGTFRFEVWIFPNSHFNGSQSASSGYIVSRSTGWGPVPPGYGWSSISFGGPYSFVYGLPFPAGTYYASLVALPDTCALGQISCRYAYRNFTAYTFFKSTSN